MKDLAKLHEDALEYEIALLEYAEMLSEHRIKICTEKDQEELLFVIPVLNGIISEAKEYRYWIKRELGIEED